MWKWLSSNQNDYRLTINILHVTAFLPFQRDRLHSTLRLEKKYNMGGEDSSWSLSPHPVHTTYNPFVSTNDQQERETESVDRMKGGIKLTVSEKRENHADWRKLLADGLGRRVFILSLSYRVQLQIFFVGKCLNPANIPYL